MSYLEMARRVKLPPEARREWSDRLCDRLHRAIARETPAGLGRWDGAWKLVEEPSKRLLDLLAEWEAVGSDRLRHEAADAESAVLVAWREAAEAWVRAGRPGLVVDGEEVEDA